jgi:NaMN:DMB phosphoribosyltransferase
MLHEPEVMRNLLFVTQSTERGQAIAMNVIIDIAKSNNVPAPVLPTLNMNLRMGEGTGALLAIPLLGSACTSMRFLGCYCEKGATMSQVYTF